MPRPPLRAAALAAFLGVLLAVPAHAADKTVVVGHDEFVPARVAVKPGDTVTWDNTGGHDHDSHNVRFEDGSFREPNPPAGPPWTASRSFPAAGEYAYYCEVHGGPGGTGMAGVVYVNAAGNVPPSAELSLAPGVARTGEAVSFSAAGSEDLDGAIVKHEWDLDGNGSYETDTGTVATASRSYSSPATLTVRLRVTDDLGGTGVATRSLRVTAPPTATFTAAPDPAVAGRIVTFDASASADPDGSISSFDWDLDGDGSYETGTGTSPTAARSYPNPGTVTVGLRVTDDEGVATQTTRTLTIGAPLQPAAAAPPPPPAAPAAPVSCGSLTGSAHVSCMQRRCRAVRGSRRARCIQRSCRHVRRGARRARCIQGSCRYVRRGKRRAACVRSSCRTLRGGPKLACLRKSCRALPGAKGRACVRRYRARR